ncbi:MAG TPA: hypothetical protein DHW78_03345 [Ruminococcaceae bacterium]|nr:hypothetical protein [Oscillospiraceae bacterium]HCC02530.1 hypothetical protein [Oscillospiraceae bacterium]HCM23349.1 hypothetical protein [Oscillospiraceae bacterium]
MHFAKDIFFFIIHEKAQFVNPFTRRDMGIRGRMLESAVLFSAFYAILIINNGLAPVASDTVGFLHIFLFAWQNNAAEVKI